MCGICDRMYVDGAHLFFKCKHVLGAVNMVKERAELAKMSDLIQVLQFILNAQADKQLSPAENHGHIIGLVIEEKQNKRR